MKNIKKELIIKQWKNSARQDLAEFPEKLADCIYKIDLLTKSSQFSFSLIKLSDVKRLLLENNREYYLEWSSIEYLSGPRVHLIDIEIKQRVKLDDKIEYISINIGKEDVLDEISHCNIDSCYVFISQSLQLKKLHGMKSPYASESEKA